MIRRSLPWIAFAVAITIAWLTLGRRIAMLADRVHTVEDQTLPVDKLTYSDGAFRIGDAILRTDLEIRSDAQGHPVISSDGRSFSLHPDPGGTSSFTVGHGVSWPTPFELNFMTGQSPSWKRHRYYHLLWTRANGSRLEMLWRYEQWFYPGLGGWSGDMNGLNPTGLVSVEIQ